MLFLLSGCTARQASERTADQGRFDHIIGAIQRVSSARWYALGIACGQSSGEIAQIQQLVQDADKILKLFNMMARKMGEKETADKLLQASMVILPPTYEAVVEDMRGES